MRRAHCRTPPLLMAMPTQYPDKADKDEEWELLRQLAGT